MALNPYQRHASNGFVASSMKRTQKHNVAVKNNQICYERFITWAKIYNCNNNMRDKIWVGVWNE